jgi:hypothetical protein
LGSESTDNVPHYIKQKVEKLDELTFVPEEVLLIPKAAVIRTNLMDSRDLKTTDHAAGIPARYRETQTLTALISC